jgi:hypothetical protein
MALAVAWIGAAAIAQTPAEAPKQTTPTASATAAITLDQFAWLRGCWAGKVERREFVESWLPARGGMMVGIGQTTVQERKQPGVEKTSDFQYLRLEERPDGVYYVAIPSGTKETTFKFTSVGEQMGRKAYTFSNLAAEFPQKIVYLQGGEGWLYAQVSGNVGDNPKEVTYPMRHVDCLTGAVLSQ